MPFTPDDAKPPLLDDVADIQKQQALWALVGAALGPGLAVAVAPVGLVLSGIAALLVYVLEINKIDVNRLLDDPPRSDYAVPVRARRRRFDATHMRTPVEAAAGGFAAEVLNLAAYLEAAVRADERGQGAEAAHDYVEQQARLFEGLRAAERAAQAGEQVARYALELADMLGAQPELVALLPFVQQGINAHAAAGDVEIPLAFAPEALDYVRQTGLVTAHLSPKMRVSRRDIEDAGSRPLEVIRERTSTYAGSTLAATRALRSGYGRRQLEVLRESERASRPDQRSSEGFWELSVEADRAAVEEQSRTEAARRWLGNVIELYAGMDAGEGDPVHEARQQARAFLEAGPTERDPFVIAQQLANALPGDRRAAELAASWREELRLLLPSRTALS